MLMTPVSETRTFPAEVPRAEEIVFFVASLAEKAGLGPKETGHLELAVEEAVVNVCSYAYDVPGNLTLTVSATEEFFDVRIEDEGIPFNPLAADDPPSGGSLDDRTPGGLGISLIRRMVHDVAYRRENHRNILLLRVRPS